MAGHRIASWVGLMAAALIVTIPMALSAPDTPMAAFHWVGVAVVTLLFSMPVLAASDDMRR